MDLPLDIDKLIQTCATDIGSNTIKSIIQTESNNNPWVINDNSTGKSYLLRTKSEAANKAAELYKQGNSIDLGLAQINSKNLPSLNLTIEQVLEPCTNIQAGAIILKNFYLQAKNIFKDDDQALFHALSAYNTGSFHKGNSYATKVTGNSTNKALYSSPIVVSWKNTTGF